ncbi:C40 family peptidase [Cohnella sp. 56]|uniref:C40 family peptidase n=1 Tax=Cohnella sp. 56 TaxID=3113722 RepID=UPI0030E7741A
MQNRLLLKTVGGVAAAAIMLGGTGCVKNPGDTANLSERYAPVRVKTNEQTQANNEAQSSVIRIRGIHNTGYVSLGDVASAAGYTGRWLADGSFGIGDNDARWRFRTADSLALRDSKALRMPAPAVKDSNRLYVPVSALSMLFGQELTMRTNGSRSISLLPRAVDHTAGAGGAGLSFGDSATSSSNSGAAGRLRIAAVGGDASDIIQQAKKYLGVKYDFGTGSYEDTGTFDCSSFVRFLFAKKGIELPRTARDQAEQGRSVGRNDLQAGDLLFFYVPGRFKTDKTVGHVGIYMGGGNMIHSSPKPEDGVQITDINKEYWQETFLYAKRLL